MTVPTSALPESLAKLVQRFSRVTNPKQGYEQLIWFSKRLPELDEADRSPENKVHGCTSQVYVASALTDGKVWYRGDSDSQLVKGLVAFLVEGLNGLEPDVIIALKPDFIQQTKLNASLTPSRANGFFNIFKKMQDQARSLQSESHADLNALGLLSSPPSLESNHEGPEKVTD